MKPAPFTYHRPRSAAEAVALLSDLGDEAKVLAGGQSLIPMLSLRLTRFEHLIDVCTIEEIRGFTVQGTSVTIGAATTEGALGSSQEIASAAPLFYRATPLIGHFQIRNRGTVGGSIAHADPAAEYPAVALTLDAEMEVLSTRGTRRIPAATFFSGLWTTDLAPDELLVRVRVPVWSGRTGFAVREFARRHGDFAIAGALVAVEVDDDDRVSRCGIGLIGLASTPLRSEIAEQSLIGRKPSEIAPEEVGQVAMSDLDAVPADLHGSAEFRRRVGAAMVARAWAEAAQEAVSG